mmetsp:Transcript_16319/g.55069  ORF Transcript_16319/g.55069 Transcript_16319/m.55069 type:complete len:207 (-) Transcript_16319:455-1075(-)
MAAPPQRKSVFWRSMDRVLPWYRFCVRFSVETMRAVLFGYDRKIDCASSTAMGDAEQPMPERLYDMTSCRILKRFSTKAQSDGVGEKREQLTMRMSMSRGSVPVLASTALTVSQMTNSDSARAASTDWSALTPSFKSDRVMPGGHAVAGPVPDRSRMRSKKLSEDSLKQPWRRMHSMSSSCVSRHDAGASKTQKSTRYTGWWCRPR